MNEMRSGVSLSVQISNIHMVVMRGLFNIRDGQDNNLYLSVHIGVSDNRRSRALSLFILS